MLLHLLELDGNSYPKAWQKRFRSCDSYRPRTRGCIIGELFELCGKDLFEHLDVGLNQAGFKTGMGCDHAHATLDAIVNGSWPSGSLLYTFLIDIKGAVDSISHASALSAQVTGEIPLSVVRVLKSWYSGLRIIINAFTSDCFSNPSAFGRGVRLGCVLSPYMFNICLPTYLRSLFTTFISRGGMCLLLYMLMLKIRSRC